MRSLRAADLGHAALLAVAGLAIAMMIVPGFTITRLWEDEAYNLTVPVALAHGQGYVSAGILAGSIPLPFDPRISTGPVVLMPIALLTWLGLDPLIAGRIVGALFFVLLAAVAYLVGRRIGGRWAGLAAVGVVLVFDASRSVSPIQGPTDVLGEVPATALTLLALLLVVDRPALAGLAIGLAMQSKSVAVLSLPVLLLAVLVTAAAGRREMLLRALRFLVPAALPSIAFELYALFSLGFSADVQRLIALARFVKSGGQSGLDTSPPAKLAAALDGWSLPAMLSAIVIAAVLALAAFVMVQYLRRTPRPLRPSSLSAAAVIAAAGVGIAICWWGWWLTSFASPDWLRQPSPGIVVGAIVIAAVATRAIGSVRVPPLRIVAAATVTVVALTATVLHIEHLFTPGETIAQQRAVAEVVAAAPGDIAYSRWGPTIPISFLAGKRPVIDNEAGGGQAGPLLAKVDDPGEGADAAERIADTCQQPIITLMTYVVCEDFTP